MARPGLPTVELEHDGRRDRRTTGTRGAFVFVLPGDARVGGTRLFARDAGGHRVG